jgi:hypothetical protein
MTNESYGRRKATLSDVQKCNNRTQCQQSGRAKKKHGGDSSKCDKEMSGKLPNPLKSQTACTANKLLNPFASEPNQKAWLEFNVGGDVMAAGAAMSVASGGWAGIPMSLAGGAMVGDGARRSWNGCKKR